MQVSNKGLAFVAQREACVLTAYRDTRLLAIGFGYNDVALKEGDTITLAEAVKRFVKTSAEYDKSLAIIFKNVLLNQTTYDALFSLVYNIGSTQLRNEHTVVDRVIAHAATPVTGRLRDQAGAAFIDVKHSEVDGYFNFSRRCREALILVSGDYGDLSQMKLWGPGKNPRRDRPDTVPMPVFKGG